MLAFVVVAYGLGGFNQWNYLTAQLRIPIVAAALIALFAPGLVLPGSQLRCIVARIRAAGFARARGARVRLHLGDVRVCTGTTVAAFDVR